MSLPTPKPGLVIRHSCLWARGHDQGHEESVKGRPCAMLLATKTDLGDHRVIVLSVTNVPPQDLENAIEIPAQTKRRLALDDDQSWIVPPEGNAFTRPGPDLRFAAGGGSESVALGFLPAALFNAMRDRFLALHAHTKARLILCTE